MVPTIISDEIMGLVENVEFWKEKAVFFSGSEVNQVIAPSGAMQRGEFVRLFYGFKSCAVLGQDAYLIKVVFCVHRWGWLERMKGAFVAGEDCALIVKPAALRGVVGRGGVDGCFRPVMVGRCPGFDLGAIGR